MQTTLTFQDPLISLMLNKSSCLIKKKKSRNFWKDINCTEIIFPSTQKIFSFPKTGENLISNEFKINFMLPLIYEQNAWLFQCLRLAFHVTSGNLCDLLHLHVHIFTTKS